MRTNELKWGKLEETKNPGEESFVGSEDRMWHSDMGSIPRGVRGTLLSEVTETLVVGIFFNYVKLGDYIF